MPNDVPDQSPLATKVGAFVLRRNLVVPGALLAMAVLGYAAARWGPRAWEPFAMFCVLFGAAFAPTTLVRNAFPLARRVAVQVEEGTLLVEGRAPLPAAHIAEAKIVPRPGRDADTEVRLVDREGRPLRLWMWARAAHALLEQLGADAGERRTTFDVVVPLGLRLLVCLPLVWGPLALTFGPVGAIAPALLFGLIAVRLAGLVRGRIRIGADGFSWRMWGPWRFVRSQDVARVRTDVRGELRVLVVDLYDGRSLAFRAVEAPDTNEQRGVEFRALATHLERAFERWKRVAGSGADVPALLARGAQSGAQWLSALDALRGGGRANYRVAAVDDATLRDLARDPAAAPDVRVGAAVALVRAGGDERRAAVRIAAEACAEPALREVLMTVAEADDDGALAAALERTPRA